MTELKQIPQALKYEIDKEGYIQTIAKQSPMIPSPRGSRTVILEANDGIRKSFNVDDLVSSAFSIEAPPQAQEIIEEEMPPTEAVEKKEVVEKSAPATKPAKEKSEPAAIKPDAKKIMALKTFMSVKIWKLHQIRVPNSEISEIVGYPHSANVQTTIESYKKSEKLRNKADKVKV